MSPISAPALEGKTLKFISFPFSSFGAAFRNVGKQAPAKRELREVSKCNHFTWNIIKRMLCVLEVNIYGIVSTF